MGKATLGKHLERNKQEGERSGEREGERKRKGRQKRKRKAEGKKGREEKVKRQAGQYAQAGHNERSGEGRKDTNKGQYGNPERNTEEGKSVGRGLASTIRARKTEKGTPESPSANRTICPGWPRGSDGNIITSKGKKVMVDEGDPGEVRTR